MNLYNRIISSCGTAVRCVALAALAAAGVGAMSDAQAATSEHRQAGAATSTLDFDKTFHHGMATVHGMRLHYVEGGTGRPVLLVPGWPESWYAWRDVMPALVASGHHVVALDPRGMGDSDHPESGYDTKTVAADLHEFVDSMHLAAHGKVDVVAHDVGAWIAYAYASDWPADVGRLALLEAAIVGVSPPAPAGIPSDAANVRTWHFAFNRLPDLPEMLVAGHEREYLGWLFAKKSAKPWAFTPAVLDEYTRDFTQPGGVRTAFAYYRAAFDDASIAANRERARRPLDMPVLAIGGQFGVGDALRDTLRSVAPDLRGSVLPGCGHFVMEECPDDVLGQLEPFLRAP